MLDETKIQLYAQHEKQIDELIARIKFTDEVLYNCIVMKAGEISAYSGNLKEFSDKCDIEAIRETCSMLRQCIAHMDGFMEEAIAKANANRS